MLSAPSGDGTPVRHGDTTAGGSNMLGSNIRGGSNMPGSDIRGGSNIGAGRNIRVHASNSPDDVAAAVAKQFLALVRGAWRDRAEWHVAVSGGSVGERVVPAVLRALVEGEVDCSPLHVWFADERWVPRGDAARNVGPVAAALRAVPSFVPEHLHPMPASDEGLSLVEGADAAGRELARLVHPVGGFPSLDLVLLGAGPDGHTASLFPRRHHADGDAPTLPVERSPKLPPERITLSMPTICAAERVWSVVTGAEKSPIVQRLLGGVGTAGDTPLPIECARGRTETGIFVDAAAAAAA